LVTILVSGYRKVVQEMLRSGWEGVKVSWEVDEIKTPPDGDLSRRK
jgi:hypothetical protein